jgi:peptide/nickel transport system substrate-binding protein
MREFGDESTSLAALAKGEVDFIRAGSKEAIETAKRFPGVKLYSYPAGWIFGFGMNLKSSFFGDARVRQALAYAIDREKMVKSLSGDNPVAWSLIGPPVSSYYNANLPKYPKDLAKARVLLNEAGFKPGPNGILQRDGKPFTFTVTIQTPVTDSDPETFAVALREAWRAIGVDMQIQRIDRPSLEKRLFDDRTFDAYLWWNGYNYEPEPRFLWHSKDPWGIHDYAGSPEVDRLIDQYEHGTTFEARKKALDQIAIKLAKEVPFIPLYFNYGFVAAKGNIKFPIPSAADWNNTGVLYDVQTIEKTQ